MKLAIAYRTSTSREWIFNKKTGDRLFFVRTLLCLTLFYYAARCSASVLIASKVC